MNRFWIALTVYAALGVLAWATLTETVRIQGRPVPIVWIVWAVLAMFALRTWLHEQRLRIEARHSPER